MNKIAWQWVNIGQLNGIAVILQSLIEVLRFGPTKRNVLIGSQPIKQ
jgi:hypothetical protein